MFRAIFICSGNICRSPMAQVAWTHRAKERNISTFAISMGTLGIFAKPPSRETVEVMREAGIALNDHRSQGVSVQLLPKANRIFVMEHAHRDALLRMDPGLSNRIRMLGSYDGDEDPEIEDPIGKDMATYRRVRDRILACVDKALDEAAGT